MPPKSGGSETDYWQRDREFSGHAVAFVRHRPIAWGTDAGQALLVKRSAAAGGRAIDAAVTLARIPLFVRAGSIPLMGSDVEYAAEKRRIRD